MILSKMILDLRNPSARQALRDCNDMHRNLMSAFELSDGESRSEIRLLYRKMTERNSIVLLVSSELRPDLDKLSRRGFVLNPSMMKETSALMNAFDEGRILKFDLLTSPCKKVSGDGKNSKRVFLRTVDERLSWLQRKAEQNGFRILTVLEDGAHERLHGKRLDMGIDYTAVHFKGVLQIEDSDRFYKAYCEGIGPGKAYGLGMLLISAK